MAMFARTSVAAAFRRWVLDVLEGLALPQHSTTGTLVNDDVLYAIWFLWPESIVMERVLRDEVPQALAWLGARQMSGALYDRLLDGLHGGVGPIEKALGPQMERVAQRVSGITYHGLR
ncbi:hypothetical protein N8H10_17775 [Curtobacterium flaccumfaciens pv. poinsettiae]|nr:hypothetical protein [Curtobacterium flaccumfaciens pv. poinsettiae]